MAQTHKTTEKSSTETKRKPASAAKSAQGKKNSADNAKKIAPSKRTATAKGNKPRTLRRKKQNSWKWKLFKLAFIGGLALFSVVCGYVFYCYLTMPNIAQAVNKTRQPSTLIVADNGSDIAKFGNVYAQVIYPDNLPQNLTKAVMAIEDHRFYKHCGFDVFGFTRAVLTNIFRKHYAQGASTITQQVAKNIFLTPQKNIKRKVQELILAFWLEQKFSKNQIMALYLNRVYFGSGNYGADAAANWYFNKSVYDLNLHEAAVLAGLLKAPNRYNPIFKRQAAAERAKVVLKNMQKYNFITQKQYQEALNLPIGNGQQYRVAGGKHFAQYAYNEVNNFIGERSEDIVVITTLDPELQATAEKILQEKIKAAKSQNVSEGAVVILDKSGAIKAMVGGVDYNRSQFNRAVQAKRQAGSSFKPFVYLSALQVGFTPQSIISDAPISIGKWKPENYSKRSYGNVSLSFALAHSLNIATVRLSKELYLKDIANNAHKMGISTDLALTPSMVLGTNGVKVLDMATAYAVLANGGYQTAAYAIEEISTQDGRQIYLRAQPQAKRILNADDVLNLTQMLEQVINGGTGQKAKLPIFAAGKTGTTQNYRDAWFIGWTNKYVAAVWVGNDDDKPMKQVTGGGLPAEIWKEIMLTTVKNTPTEAPKYKTYNAPMEDIGSLIDNANISDENDDAIGALIDGM